MGDGGASTGVGAAPGSDPPASTQRLQLSRRPSIVKENTLSARHKESGLGMWRFLLTGMFYIWDPEAYRQQALAHPYRTVGGLSASERAALEASHSKDRPFLVLSWICQLMTFRHRDGGIPTQAPVLSRTYQLLSDGHLHYMSASKVAYTPFPFPYVQLVSLLLHVFNALAPLIVSAFIGDMEHIDEAGVDMAGGQGSASVGQLAIIAVIAFFVSLGYTSLNQVARELEEPYGHGPNHLPLVQFQDEWNARLIHLMLPDAGGAIPDDPFIGSSTADLSEEEKQQRRDNFGKSAAQLISAQLSASAAGEEISNERRDALMKDVPLI